MKKIFAIVLGAALMLSATNAFAQLSVGAGWLNTTEKSVYNNGNPEKSNFNGFYAGGQYSLPVVGGLSVAPGLYVSMLFGKETGTDSGYGLTLTGESKYQELALNLPVNLAYTFEIGDFNVFAYAGPVFQYGLISKSSGTLSGSFLGFSASTGEITEDNYTGKVSDKDGNSQSTDPSRNPFNIYIGGGAGIQAGQFQVIVGYDHSILNFSKVDKENISRSQIKIGVGYAF